MEKLHKRKKTITSNNYSKLTTNKLTNTESSPNL